MKGKSLWAACVIVVLAAICLSGYLLASAQQGQVDRYTLLHEQQGQLIVQLGQHLVWLDADGQERNSLDLTRLGVRAEGDFALFSNGDVLLYHRPQAASFLDNLKAFFRLQASHPPALKGAEGLKRCNIDGCSDFSRQLPAFEGAFRLLIEPDSQRVHIAHTSEFRMYLLDEQGQLLAKGDEQSLRFPNQLLLRDGQLWVADTNNQRLAQLNTEPDQYGEILQTLPISLSQKHRWPHEMAWDGQAWWVNLGDHNLSYGRLVQLDQQGQLLNEIKVQPLSDPLAIAWFAGQLWFNEFEAIKLWRVDPLSQAVTGHQSATLQRLEEHAQRELAYWQLIGRIALGGMACVFLGGLLAAWRLEPHETRKVLQRATQPLAQAIAQPAATLPVGEVFWLDNQAARWHGFLWASLPLSALFIACAMALLTLQDRANFPYLASVLSALMVATLGAMLWFARTLGQQRIGLQEQALWLEQAPNQRICIPWEHVLYTPQHLLHEQACVVIATSNVPLFAQQQLQQYLYPRLKNARAVSVWRAQKMLYRARHPALYLQFLPVFGVLLAAVLLLMQ